MDVSERQQFFIFYILFLNARRSLNGTEISWGKLEPELKINTISSATLLLRADAMHANFVTPRGINLGNLLTLFTVTVTVCWFSKLA